MKRPRFRSCIYFSVTATVAFTGFICLPAQAGSFVINEQSIEHDIRGSAQFSGVPVITASGAFSPLPGVTLPIPAFPAGNALRNVFFNQNASARLNLPEIYHFSIYQRFLHNFALMGDIELQRWTRLQQIPITFDNPGTPANVLNLQYKDAYRYSVGLEWYAAKQLTLRTGFAYDETPIKNATLRDPRIPDNNRYFLSAGLQYKPLPYLAFDVGYAHLFIPDPQVNFNDGQGSYPARQVRHQYRYPQRIGDPVMGWSQRGGSTRDTRETADKL
jgi:hypothetical protein